MKILIFKFLINACERHFVETKLLINQLSDDIILSEPVITGRNLGEIFLHIIRSSEFYSRGLAEDIWEPLAYNLKVYNNTQKINDLYNDVLQKIKVYFKVINDFEEKDNKLLTFNRQATRSEILLEMIEHNVQHRGQIIVYYRLLDIKPAIIQYII